MAESETPESSRIEKSVISFTPEGVKEINLRLGANGKLTYKQGEEVVSLLNEEGVERALQKMQSFLIALG